MAKIIERREELLNAADELQRERFGKSVHKLMEIYQIEENRQAVIQAFKELASRGGEFHKDSDDGKKAASLGITYLLSSILTKTYDLKLSLLGEGFWLEGEPVEILWKPPYFFEYFEEDMAYIIKELRNRFPRLCSAEEDAVRLKCVEYYLAAVRKLCTDMAEEIMEIREFRELNKTEKFFLFFGRFQGEGERLWSISN